MVHIERLDRIIEMASQKREVTRQPQGIAALPYNHYVEEAVKKIQQEYGV